MLTIIYSRFISVINDCIHSHMVVLYILNDNQAIRRPLTPASGWESVANLGSSLRWKLRRGEILFPFSCRYTFELSFYSKISAINRMLTIYILNKFLRKTLIIVHV